MHAYRDQYAQLFHDGRNVVLIAISVDLADTLAAWARDDQFPYLFASDSGGVIGKTYGAHGGAAGVEQHRERQRVIREVAPDRGRRLIHTDADRHEPHRAAEARVRRRERGLERLTEGAPRGPELQQHRLLADVAAQVHRLPVQVLERDRRGPGTDGETDVLCP